MKKIPTLFDGGERQVPSAQSPDLKSGDFYMNGESLCRHT